MRVRRGARRFYLTPRGHAEALSVPHDGRDDAIWRDSADSSAIGDEEVFAGVDRDPERVVQRSASRMTAVPRKACITVPRDSSDASTRRDLADLSVGTIGDEEVSGRIDRDPSRFQ